MVLRALTGRTGGKWRAHGSAYSFDRSAIIPRGARITARADGSAYAGDGALEMRQMVGK